MTSTSSASSTLSANGSEPIIRICLDDEDQWREFREKGNEMVLTPAGRNFYPRLSYKIEGLNKEYLYSCSIRIELFDDRRYKYHSKRGWEPSGPMNKTSEKDFKEIIHKNFAKNGEFWMRSRVHFPVKITNNAKNDNADTICLTSMCRYIPVFTIRRVPYDNFFVDHSTLVPELEYREPLCAFFAVTAYQNLAIRDIKTLQNPYAKGHREKIRNSSNDHAVKTARKRRSEPSDSSSTQKIKHNKLSDGFREDLAVKRLEGVSPRETESDSSSGPLPNGARPAEDSSQKSSQTETPILVSDNNNSKTNTKAYTDFTINAIINTIPNTIPSTIMNTICDPPTFVSPPAVSSIQPPLLPSSTPLGNPYLHSRFFIPPLFCPPMNSFPWSSIYIPPPYFSNPPSTQGKKP